MTGAEAALPIWMDIMKAWIGDRKEPPQFASPGNIVFVTVDKGTGDPAAEGTPARFPKRSSPARSRGRFDNVQCCMFNVQWPRSQNCRALNIEHT